MCFLPLLPTKAGASSVVCVCVCFELLYLIKIGGNEGDGVTGSCHLDETAVYSVPHWRVLIHPMEQITQPVEKIKQMFVKNVPVLIFKCHASSLASNEKKNFFL